jgi:hypothetical protein
VTIGALYVWTKASAAVPPPHDETPAEERAAVH